MHKTSLRDKLIEETLETVKKFQYQVGITRVADITHLDNMGIPVFTAVRPSSKSLTVSQGKGLSKSEAMCSAIMESIEVYYAEECMPDIEGKCIQELSKLSIAYVSPNSLNSVVNIYDENTMPINWVRCSSMISDSNVMLPHAEFCMNSCLEDVVLYSPNTTGLASGNTYQDALLHSLLEVIERASSTEVYNVVNISNNLYENVLDKVDIHILSHNNIFKIPCFEVSIKSKNPFENQVIFTGKGCHLNRCIALNRAITEAFQSRLTVITGSRDDISIKDYDFKNYEFEVEQDNIDFKNIQSIDSDNVGYCLDLIVDKCKDKELDILTYQYLADEIVVIKSKIIEKSCINYE